MRLVSHHHHHRQNLLATSFSIGTAFFLTFIKIIVGFFSGSLAIIASALDSFLDTIISTVNYFTVRAAAKPPDADHRFGHGKFEAFAELAQGVFIGGSGLFLVFESVRRFFSPVEVEHELLAMGIMILSIFLSFFLVLYLSQTAKKTGSLIVKADSAHFRSDLYANFSVIIGLIAVHFTEIFYIDSLISLGISFIILHSAWELLQESFGVLTDKEIPEKERNKIVSILDKKREGVTGWHVLRTRKVGSEYHIDFHLVFTPEIPLIEAHIILEDIECEIRKIFPKSVILGHLDPYDDEDENIRNGMGGGT